MGSTHFTVSVCGWGPALEVPEIKKKWRPSLLLVIATCLATVFILPVFGFVILRWITPIFGWKISVVWISLGLLLATTTIGFLQWRLLLRPIQHLARSSRALAEGTIENPLPMERYGTSELRDLGGNVLAMATGLIDQKKAIQGYADHVVHELKTPVTALNAAAELLQTEGLSEAQKSALLADLHISARRMDNLLNALRAHAASAVRVVRGRTFISDLPCVSAPDVHLFGVADIPMDHDSAEAVFQQIIHNARQAGATRIDICADPFGVIIGDNGHGISNADLNQAFDPFFTTKRGSGGTGMGLSIVKTLVESGGGTVALWHKSGGAVVEVHF
ncbi:MAG: sensor histidine kinase [Planktomarina sp.]